MTTLLDSWKGRQMARRIGFEYDTEGPRILQAAAVALAVLRKVGVATWDEFANLVAVDDPTLVDKLDGVTLTSEQWELLGEYPEAVASVAAGSPARRLIVCDTCGEHLVVADGGVPRKCRMTFGCDGQYVSAPTTRQIAVDEPAAA